MSIYDLLNRSSQCDGATSTETTETLLGVYNSEGETTFIYEAESLPQATTAITNSELSLFEVGTGNQVGTLGSAVANCIDNGGTVRVEVQGSTEAGNFTQDFFADGYTLQDGLNFAGDIILNLTGDLPSFTFGFGKTFTFQLSAYCVSAEAVSGSDSCFAANGDLEEPDCDEWDEGFICSTVNLLKKLNWLFNRVTCAIKGIDERVTAIEGIRRLVDVQLDANSNQIIEIYSDGTTESNDISVYLDDTTDQVQSVSYNPATGVLTITNEDGSQVSSIIASSSAFTPVISNAVLGSVSYGAISSNGFPEGNYDSGNTNLSVSVPSVAAGSTYMLVQAELVIRGELNSGQDDMTGYITVRGASGGSGRGQARVHADGTSNANISSNYGTFSDTRSVLLWVRTSSPTIRYRIFRQSSTFVPPLNKGAGLYQLTVRPIGYV